MQQRILDSLSSAGSRLKIERAEKHIRDINALLEEFVASDFYSVEIETNGHCCPNYLRFHIDTSGFRLDIAAVVIGDALHNLRSALDLLYYAAILECGGRPTRWTRFPVFDTGKDVENKLREALKKKQITTGIQELLLDTIKPYEAGNYALWAVNELNITDKHQLLIPTLQLMRFVGICLEDEKGDVVMEDTAYFMDTSGRVRLDQELDCRTITLTDKGHAAATIMFNIGLPFQAQAVIPTLHQLVEVVSGVVESFRRAGFVK